MRTSAVSWVVAALVLVSGASAQSEKSDPALDAPKMESANSPTEQSIVSASCKLVPGSSPRKAKCSMSQAILEPPAKAKAELAKREKELTELAKNPAALRQNLRDNCDADTIAEWRRAAARSTKPFQDVFRKLASACQKKSVPEMIRALRALAKLDAQTCTLRSRSYELEFVQQDADTWTAVNPGGGCVAKVTATLFRESGDDLWHYKQVRSLADDADPAKCTRPNSTPAEWRTDTPGFRDAQCKYFDF